MLKVLLLVLAYMIAIADFACAHAQRSPHDLVLYVQNGTKYDLKFGTGGQVRPGRLGVFAHYTVPRRTERVHLMAEIMPLKDSNVRSCYIGFHTYPHFTIYEQSLQTVIFVTEHDGKLHCTPRAAQVSLQDRLVPGGLRLSIHEARKRSHEADKALALYGVENAIEGPPIVIYPYVYPYPRHGTSPPDQYGRQKKVLTILQ